MNPIIEKKDFIKTGFQLENFSEQDRRIEELSKCLSHTEREERRVIFSAAIRSDFVNHYWVPADSERFCTLM